MYPSVTVCCKFQGRLFSYDNLNEQSWIWGSTFQSFRPWWRKQTENQNVACSFYMFCSFLLTASLYVCHVLIFLILVLYLRYVFVIIQGPSNELIPNSNNPLTELFVFWNPNLNLETGLCVHTCMCYISYISWNWGFVTDW